MMRGTAGAAMARVAAVQGLTDRSRTDTACVRAAMAALALILSSIVLLPAHGAPAHAAATPGDGGAMSVHSLAQGAEHQAPSGGTHACDHHAPHNDDAPACHAAPHYADSVQRRQWDEFTGPDLSAALAMSAGVLAAAPSAREPNLPGRQWCSNPHWRPSGSDLLTHVCIART